MIRKNTVSFLTEVFSQTRLLLSCNEKLLTDVSLTGSEYVQQSIIANKPIIFVLPHDWGIDYAGLRLNAEIPMVSMAKPHKNPIYNWLAAKIRTSNGGKIYKREAGLRSIISELKQNKSFLYLPDEDLGEKHSVFAQFFSTPKATLPVVARLARASNATVIPVSLGYCDQSHQYKLNLFAPLELSDMTCKEDEAQVLNQVIEKIIRASPEQYMWFLRILKTRPDGKKGFYKREVKNQR